MLRNCHGSASPLPQLSSMWALHDSHTIWPVWQSQKSNERKPTNPQQDHHRAAAKLQWRYPEPRDLAITFKLVVWQSWSTRNVNVAHKQNISDCKTGDQMTNFHLNDKLPRTPPLTNRAQSDPSGNLFVEMLIQNCSAQWKFWQLDF